jgi:hypothetical protein
MNLWIVLPAIALLALLYVLVPVAATTFSRYRGMLLGRCPETHGNVRLRFDPIRAAVSSCFGRTRRSVLSCSLWPARRGCGQECSALPEHELRESRGPGSA